MKHPRTSHRGVIILGVLFLLVFVQLALAAPAAAQAFTGGFSPTIINGEADLNGDGVVTGRDDSNAFYGDTSIIDGRLDCDAWAGPNDGVAGDGVIAVDDDCTLIGYDGTPDGVTIVVSGGEFQVADGPLPTVFNAADPDNPDVGASDFAWSTIDGRVDSNGDEMISGDDCHFGLIGETVDAGLGVPTDGADILGNPGANECGFANPPDPADDGLVDLNSDGEITAADSCTNGCFFGHNVQNGFVMQLECPGFEGDPRNDVRGTAGNDTLVGTGGADIICGLGGHDTLLGRGGNDVLLGGAGEDSLSGGGGRDRLFGQSANDLLLGGARGDFLSGGTGADHLRGGSGADVLSGRGGLDRLFGQGGRDFLLGGARGDFLSGGSGADVLRGGRGNDVLRGRGGRDRLFGQSGRDLLLGGGRADFLSGGSGADVLRGGRGNDVLRGGFGNDHLDGGSGFDGCSGGPGSDTFVRCEA